MSRYYEGHRLILTTTAGKVIRHVHKDLELLGLGLREAVDTRNIVLDSQVLRDDTVVSCLHQVTCIRTGSVGVHLVLMHVS